MKNKEIIHPEVYKQENSTIQEMADNRFTLLNEKHADYYERMNQLINNYYKAKISYFEDGFRNQLQIDLF